MLIVSIALSKLFFAAKSEFWCRTLLITVSLFNSISPPKNISFNRLVNSSIPVPSFADTEIIFSLLTISQISLMSISFGKSILFNITIAFLLRIISNICLSSSVSERLVSAIINIRSALAAYSLDFSTPIFSTVSWVSRMPAVSTILTGTPPIFINSSTVSLVVPGISVTMARSSSKRKFNSELLPTLGLPKITVEIPSRIILPLSAESISF
ncbi:hypothetical protein SDC9_163894 [bioreactor metagenome]|uniref:Uncharacterized protein n=1 Tax=bioreactor metagenome TaxID=1076179 RepID=A0A645FSY6_9ZZZZ